MTRTSTLKASRTRKARGAPDRSPAADLSSAADEVTAPAPPPPPTRGGTKLELLISHLRRSEGATVAQLANVLGWQAHSVRGAMAGALKARGHVVTSQRTEAGRVYRLPEVAGAAEGAAK